jgi:hypothetical protein
MAVVMRVGAALDERAVQRVADKAERQFADAGARAGKGFGVDFQTQVERALDEKAIEKSARKIESRLARAGKTSAEQFNSPPRWTGRTGTTAKLLLCRLDAHIRAIPRQPVVADRGIVSPRLQDLFYLLLAHLAIAGRFGFPKDFFAQRQLELARFESEISDDLLVGARATHV